MCRLREFDEMVVNIVKFCEAEGIGPRQVARASKPLTEALACGVGAAIRPPPPSPRRGRRTRGRLIVVVVVALAFASVAAFRSEAAGRFVEAVARLAAIQVLPWYDWTTLYYSTCLVKNPSRAAGGERGGLDATDCLVCEDFDRIPVWENASAREVSGALANDLPVLVASSGFAEASLESLLDAYDDLAAGTRDGGRLIVCNLLTNLKVAAGKDVSALLKRLRRAGGPGLGQGPRWFIHWENCDVPEVKALRRFYVRPSFLPLSLDLTDTNWVFMTAGGYATRVPKDVPFSSPAFVLGQVVGRTEVRLTPARRDCARICNDLTAVLGPGDTLVVPGRMWKLSYATVPEEEESIAFGIAAFWDSG